MVPIVQVAHTLHAACMAPVLHWAAPHPFAHCAPHTNIPGILLLSHSFHPNRAQLHICIHTAHCQPQGQKSCSRHKGEETFSHSQHLLKTPEQRDFYPSCLVLDPTSTLEPSPRCFPHEHPSINCSADVSPCFPHPADYEGLFFPCQEPGLPQLPVSRM